MRSLLLAMPMLLCACAADPVLLPDSGPCSSACGAGTVCSGGACVAVDAGTVDVGAPREDRPVVVDLGSPMDAGAPVDVGVLKPSGWQTNDILVIANWKIRSLPCRWASST